MSIKIKLDICPPLKAQYVVFVCVCNNFCQMSIKIQLDICPRLKAYTSVKPWLDIAPPPPQWPNVRQKLVVPLFSRHIGESASPT